jgi:hypothetical protein
VTGPETDYPDNFRPSSYNHEFSDTLSNKKGKKSVMFNDELPTPPNLSEESLNLESLNLVRKSNDIKSQMSRNAPDSGSLKSYKQQIPQSPKARSNPRDDYSIQEHQEIHNRKPKGFAFREYTDNITMEDDKKIMDVQMVESKLRSGVGRNLAGRSKISGNTLMYSVDEGQNESYSPDRKIYEGVDRNISDE